MRPDDRRYAKSHEWAKLESGQEVAGAVVVVGITDFAVEQLTDLVFVELPEKGTKYAQGDPFGVIESVKAVSDLYAPVAGEVIEVHESLQDDLDQVAKDPFGAGWLIKLRLQTPGEWRQLLSRSDYEASIEESH